MLLPLRFVLGVVSDMVTPMPPNTRELLPRWGWIGESPAADDVMRTLIPALVSYLRLLVAAVAEGVVVIDTTGETVLLIGPGARKLPPVPPPRIPTCLV